jgi:hypothetical protein
MEDNKPDFDLDRVALDYAIQHSSAPDKDTPDWIIADFKAGYTLASERYKKELEERDKEIERLKDENDKRFKCPYCGYEHG